MCIMVGKSYNTWICEEKTNVTLSAKTSLILGENKAGFPGFPRESHKCHIASEKKGTTKRTPT